MPGTPSRAPIVAGFPGAQLAGFLGAVDSIPRERTAGMSRAKYRCIPLHPDILPEDDR
jgi:hypothetical protein